MHTQGERATPTTKHLRSPGDVPDPTRTHEGNKLEKSYIELTPGTPVWLQHRQNTTWEPATVVSQCTTNSYWIMQENGTEQPKVYRRTRFMLKIRSTPNRSQTDRVQEQPVDRTRES